MSYTWHDIAKMASKSERAGEFDKKFEDEPGYGKIKAQNYKSEDIGELSYTE